MAFGRRRDRGSEPGEAPMEGRLRAKARGLVEPSNGRFRRPDVGLSWFAIEPETRAPGSPIGRTG